MSREQPIGQEGAGEEHEERAQGPVWRVEPQHPGGTECHQGEEQVRAPALGGRVGAVDEVVDLVPDEGPAGPTGCPATSGRQDSPEFGLQTASTTRKRNTGGTR